MTNRTEVTNRSLFFVVFFMLFHVLLLALFVDCHHMANSEVFDLYFNPFYKVALIVNYEGSGLAFIVI